MVNLAWRLISQTDKNKSNSQCFNSYLRGTKIDMPAKNKNKTQDGTPEQIQMSRPRRAARQLAFLQEVKKLFTPPPSETHFTHLSWRQSKKCDGVNIKKHTHTTHTMFWSPRQFDEAQNDLTLKVYTISTLLLQCFDSDAFLEFAASFLPLLSGSPNEILTEPSCQHECTDLNPRKQSLKCLRSDHKKRIRMPSEMHAITLHLLYKRWLMHPDVSGKQQRGSSTKKGFN